jgi:arylsulfatase A-like enzyme
VVVEAPADRSTLTRRYTEEAVRFITANRDRPFFLYLAHAMPGSTASPFASEAFRGRSANGPYGDAVEEIDWSMGKILEALASLGLDDRTLIFWTSDNGAVHHRPPQGSNAPLRGWGYTAEEGGMRVPGLVRWPGKVPAGSLCNELCTAMDLLPTFSRLAGGGLPPGRLIDGYDAWALWSGRPGAKTPYEAFYYYYMDQLQAVRSGPWKLYLPLAAKRIDFRDGRQAFPAELYDLEADLGETENQAGRRPDIVARLSALADKAREDLGDSGREGRNQRPAGRVSNPTPRVLAAGG